MKFKYSVIGSGIFLLMACQSTGTGNLVSDSLEQAAEQQKQRQAMPKAPLEQVPDDVEGWLQQGQAGDNVSNTEVFIEERYDISAHGAGVRGFFAGLVADTDYSVAVHPEVDGSISLDLKQATMAEIVALVEDMYGYDIQQSGKVFKVFPAGMRTETFSLNYLQMRRNGMTQTSISSGGVSQNANNNRSGGRNNNFGNQGNMGGLGGGFGGMGNNMQQQGFGGMGQGSINGTNIMTNSENDFWKDLEETLESFVGEGGGRSILVSPQSGLVTVRAMPDELRVVREFLSKTERNIQRQVVLEARIVEVTLNDQYQQGINWSKIANSSRLGPITFSGANVGNSITNSLGGITGVSFETGSFSGILNLLSTQGNMQVLSSPRVTATNNQKAVIKVGDDEYFVTDVQSDVSAGTNVSQTSSDIELTPFFSGIALDVTPQINDEGSVLLHVHPSVIETEEQEKIITVNGREQVLPLARSNIRESDTVIRADSGEIVVIGGLMQTIIEETHSKTPLLGDIPWLGELFKNRRDEERKKELVIMLKPTVVGPGTWQEQLSQSEAQVKGWLNE